MLGLLIKQNLRGLIAPMMINPKNGTMRKKSYLVLVVLLFVFCFGSVGFSLGGSAFSLCKPLIAAGGDWAYFCIMSFIGLTFSLFLSSTSCYSVIYTSKDNNILLPLPIESHDILLSRIAVCFATALPIILITVLPAYIVYFITVGSASFADIIVCILMLFALTMLSLSISCLIGYLMALISAHMKNKNLITVIVVFLFIFCYSTLNSLVISNLEEIVLMASKSKSSIAMLIGSAFTGNIIGIISVYFIVGIIGFLSYLLVKKTFVKMITIKKGFRKKKFELSMIKETRQYLIKREFRHLFGNVNYLLNTAIGSFMAVFAAIAVFIVALNVDLSDLLINIRDFAVLIIAGGSVIMCCMNDIASVGISIETKNLWIIRSMPISSKDIIKSKIATHVIMTSVPVALLAAALSFLFTITLAEGVLAVIVAMIYGFFSACIGLLIDIKHPKNNWENEVAIYKQSLSVLADMAVNFFGSAFVFAAGLFITFAVNCYVGMLVIIVLYSFISLLAYNWIITKGSKILEKL